MQQNKSKKKVLREAHQLNLHDGFINFWQAIFMEVLEPLTSNFKVLEFGSQNSKFLQFVYLHCKYQKAVGLFLDVDGVPDLEYWGIPEYLSLEYFPENHLCRLDEKFNLAFSLEVFSLLNKDELVCHAQKIFDTLTDDGVYYSVFGWHTNNSNFIKQKQIRERGGKPFFEHSLDDIAEVFDSVGFEVCIKRLSLPYYLVYEKEVMNKRFDNVYNMVSNYQDNQMIFSFRK